MVDGMSRYVHSMIMHSLRDASGTPVKKLLKALRTSSRAGNWRARRDASPTDAPVFTVNVISAGRSRPEQCRRPGLFDDESEAVIRVFAQCAEDRAT